jgi:hypothetical protein
MGDSKSTVYRQLSINYLRSFYLEPFLLWLLVVKEEHLAYSGHDGMRIMCVT